MTFYDDNHYAISDSTEQVYLLYTEIKRLVGLLDQYSNILPVEKTLVTYEIRQVGSTNELDLLIRGKR